MLSGFLVFLFLAAHGAAQFGPTAWTVTPFNPPALPFAVKSPYVNTWSPLGNASEAVTSAWPRTWDKGFDIMAWYSAIRVDGKAYQILGQAPTPQLPIASQQQVVYTPTQVSYIIAAGGVDVNMTFLSPLEPTDLVRQSMPFAYMYITLQPNDGKAHDVQLYTDVSGEWIAGDKDLPTNWTINESNNFVYLQMQPSSPLPFQELNVRPQDGTLYYCTKKSDNVTWQIANSADLRNSFGNGSVTSLPKTAEANFHPLGIPDYDTMGIAVDLGTVNSISETLVYALGVVRDPVVQYANQKVQIEKRSSYYWSKFTNVHDVAHVLDNFDNAVTASTTIDNKILRDASQISSNYGDILRLSTLPAMGALEYTILKDSSGTFNTSDIKAFLSDLGGIGSGGAVDVLYAAMPAYLYLNPAILGYLLSPLMEYQESTQYTNPYAAQDLGSQFPNATGNSNGHDQGIEHSANMLIISLAHAQISGDGSLLNQHYNLLSGWGNYLVNNTMNPEDQASSLSDAILSSNQTNLILKGIIGIGAMAKISGYMGYTDVQNRFQGIAQQYMQKWTSLAVDAGQIRISFGSTSSGIIYNLYADKLLQLKLVPSSVYDTQTQYYKSQTSLFKCGIPLDASNMSSTAHWMMFGSAAVTDTTVRDAMIEQIRSYLSAELQNRPFPILYNPRDGTQLGGENRCVIGLSY
ncbi:uncharacterized protein FOMMEDRAFT_96129 [Fomitiporia mediterranea MF3/22]|uniref:uncharacterized protein n=1 Tax=Fomitiporia mediterranea (strain MF3/22) TaxID=694068 RepID=UPI0004408F6A|nr:uncharacterized protein FOMMEDRAFT_96129 [Fomitiporia mediterranea MF3/22]EJC98583.1 hypothetical protein FOMMEDRAFT_96129 [Fomitiporia mediterranea MF3/22]